MFTITTTNINMHTLKQKNNKKRIIIDTIKIKTNANTIKKIQTFLKIQK